MFSQDGVICEKQQHTLPQPLFALLASHHGLLGSPRVISMHQVGAKSGLATKGAPQREEESPHW